MKSRYAILLLGLLLLPKPAQGYLVGRPVSLDVLTAEADIIFKGTAVSSVPGNDKRFSPMFGFGDLETRFTVVSVIKGELTGGSLKFRHYDYLAQSGNAMYEPQYYHFDLGRTYLVFGKRTETPGVFQQLWVNPVTKGDQGVVSCADNRPVSSKNIKEVVWSELIRTLQSTRVSDARYAIGQLDQMSGGGWHNLDATSDFDRRDVLAAVRGFMTNLDPDVAQAAIGVVGSHNPYMTEYQAAFWLGTVGVGMPGLSKMDPEMKNVGGELYWNTLVAVADSQSASDTRALAVAALGLVHNPALENSIVRWLHDHSAAVRSSATVLLADFPDIATHERLSGMAGDPDSQVRASAARSIGFGQYTIDADILSRLLMDQSAKVREAAAMSLLSFSPKTEAIAAIFKANLSNQEFAPLFLNALAQENPSGYVDGLADAVEKQTEPTNWWGGGLPAAESWEILFKYLQAQPVKNVTSGKLDRYLDAMEKVGRYSSSEPRDVYAFYVQRGMTERANNFREKAEKAVTYDLDYFFKLVDQNPSLYCRTAPVPCK